MNRFLTVAFLTIISCAVSFARADDAPPARVGDAYPLAVDPLGDKLGDDPVALIHEGRHLLFANAGNVESFKKDPKSYLAKVDAMIVESQSADYPLKKCLVSGEQLGSMGDPLKIVVGNRLVELCCKSCMKKAVADPAGTLAKLNAAVIAAQKTSYPLGECVVSGDPFGPDMGEPIDFVSGTHYVKFCCKGCIRDFEANPARYLARIDAARAAH